MDQCAKIELKLGVRWKGGQRTNQRRRLLHRLPKKYMQRGCHMYVIDAAVGMLRMPPPPPPSLYLGNETTPKDLNHVSIVVM